VSNSVRDIVIVEERMIWLLYNIILVQHRLL